MPHRVSRTRRRIRRVFEWTHRWLSLVLGIALLAITTTGAVLLYKTDLYELAHPGLHETTEGEPIGVDRALATARQEIPDLAPEGATLYHGAWIVDGHLEGDAAPARREVHIDAASGRVLGVGDSAHGLLGWTENFHDCLLSCEDYAGYTPFLAKVVPVLGNEELTVGGLILAVTGLILAWLVLTGLWLWWPSIKRLARGWSLRTRRGPYAFNYDLHKLVGIAALPFLAMWAVTGTGFELKQVEDAWYAMLPGTKPPEYAPPASKPPKGKSKESVSPGEAAQLALRAEPQSTLAAVYLPDRTDKASAYEVYVSDGFDPYGHSIYKGDVGIGVDRYSGATSITYPTAYADRPVAQALWQDFQFGAHAGSPVNGWVRVIWLVFGVAPLALATTGVITWLMRRRRRKRKRRPRRTRATVAA
jgi:uncharacterized iron-regulated membrane protein